MFIPGWGDGFKNLTLISPSFATNFGHNGRTTATFVSGPDWENVLTAAKTALSEGFMTYVTIMVSAFFNYHHCFQERINESC